MTPPDTSTPPIRKAELERSRQTTMAALEQVDDTEIIKLTRLTLPEIQAIKQEIAQVLPAGNLPAFVLNGLLQLKGRRVSPDQVRRDLTALLRGMDLVPQSVYGVLVAGPAAVLYAYQKILELSGKSLTAAFPQGTWQFYLQLGLREDTARHANEVIGFHQAFSPQFDRVQGAAAWLCAAGELLFSYDELLRTDWMERVRLRLLVEEAAQVGIAGQAPFATAIREWNRRCPYRRPPDGTYLSHRQGMFQQVFQGWFRSLPDQAQDRFRQRYEARVAQELPAYQEQMTILAALRPDRYQEEKESYALWQAAIAFVWQGHTYLLPACRRDAQSSPLCYPPASGGKSEPVPLYVLDRRQLCDADREPLRVDRSGRVWYRDGRLLGHLRPPAPETVLGWVSAICSQGEDRPASELDLLLATTPRLMQAQLREKLPAATQVALAGLRRAPLLINWDSGPRSRPLAEIRQGRRGIGDHALTLFRTDGSFVVDQSHIFFDGMWGLSVAEILTDGAIHWYRQLSRSSPLEMAPPAPLKLACTPQAEALARAHRLKGEAAAESSGVDLRRLQRLREWLRQRGVRLTVNDVLLLYRFFHAAGYEPSDDAEEALAPFREQDTSGAARDVLATIEATLTRFRETNPALLIPMSASNVAPRERVFPTTFRNPLIDVRERFAVALEAYRACSGRPRSEGWDAFDRARRELLAYLKAFGQVLDALKAVTMRGESFNTVTIRLLGHLPASMQHLLDGIPQRVGFLNEIIKGNEVFSNVGRVAPGSSLTRFISAKDDGAAKELIWGVLTDDRGRMHVSLRDFRPFVPKLLDLGEGELANLLAQDYLDGYVRGLNRFVDDLRDMITAGGRGR